MTDLRRHGGQPYRSTREWGTGERYSTGKRQKAKVSVYFSGTGLGVGSGLVSDWFVTRNLVFHATADELPR
jgi:hypothetical protein